MPNLKFFTKDQFQTYIAVIEAIIETDSYALSPEKTALRMDDFLSSIDSPTVQQLPTLLFYVRHLLPLNIWKFKKFHNLSKEDRKKALKNFIKKKHFFRDIARAMKVLTCVPYYSSPEGRKSVGFVEFEARNSFANHNTNPINHGEPQD